MKYEIKRGGTGRANGPPTSRREPAVRVLRILSGVALVVAAVAGLALTDAVGLVGPSVPAILLGWMASVAVAVALPFAVVRVVGALLAVAEG